MRVFLTARLVTRRVGAGKLTRRMPPTRAVEAAGADEKKVSGVNEYIDIYCDLRGRCVLTAASVRGCTWFFSDATHVCRCRYLPMIEVMIPVVRSLVSVRFECVTPCDSNVCCARADCASI
jgi:hypothetical protein